MVEMIDGSVAFGDRACPLDLEPERILADGKSLKGVPILLEELPELLRGLLAVDGHASAGELDPFIDP